jgi:hypothetical protein
MSVQIHTLGTKTPLIVAALWMAMAAALCSSDTALAQTVVPTSSGKVWPKASFPLRIAAGKRYLEDAVAQPFLIHGDTAWSLIAQLKREDAEKYLQDRQERGFNTILVNLLEHRFSSHPPANAYRQQPFLTPGDFTTPNEDYFAHADWLLRQAAERGILVLLAPAYVGSLGGDHGWYGEMVANGPDKLRAYGRYLGRRYREFTNILWVHSGDWDPPRKDLVRAIADGIREFDAYALHTVHNHPDTMVLDYWKGEQWLQLSSVFTYNRVVYASALKEYARPEQMPYFLIESAYEHEHQAGGLRVRSQAYQALLSGASGHVYGNNPIWHFDGPGLYPAPTSWQTALYSSGARSMTHVRTLFASIPWWRLVPDTKGILVNNGTGTGHDRAVAAMTDDRMLALVYLPSTREVRINLQRLQGRSFTARWYDPAEGRYIETEDMRPPVTEARSFVPPGSGGGSNRDWILIIEAAT